MVVRLARYAEVFLLQFHQKLFGLTCAILTKVMSNFAQEIATVLMKLIRDIFISKGHHLNLTNVLKASRWGWGTLIFSTFFFGWGERKFLFQMF